MRMLSKLVEGHMRLSMAVSYGRAARLSCCCAGSGEARREVDEAGLLAQVHHLVASTNPPAVAAGGATAALLQATALLPYAGFAVTAKPSVNLLVLLQVCCNHMSLLPDKLSCTLALDCCDVEAPCHKLVTGSIICFRPMVYCLSMLLQHACYISCL